MSTWTLDAGPLLRYDTTDNHNIYHAFVLIVTSHAAGSTVEQPPILQYNATAGDRETGSVRQSNGTRIWIFRDEKSAEHHFWRFKLEVALAEVGQVITYAVPGATEAFCFHIPAVGENFRWATYSCSGFSASVNQEEFNGRDPLWNDLLREHESRPFHALVGGGDQLYNDGIAKQEAVAALFNPKELRKGHQQELTPEAATAIENFLFSNYCKVRERIHFSASAKARSLGRQPKFPWSNGFGTYPDRLMNSAVFNTICKRGYFFYLLFQQFMNDELDRITPNTDNETFRSLIVGGPGAYIPYPTHNLLVYLGPKQAILLIDCRAQRKIDQVCARDTYERCFRAAEALPSTVQHLIIQLDPRMVFLEKLFASKHNPFMGALKMCLPAFTNSTYAQLTGDFNGQVELLDDLADHWCAHNHKRERNRLVIAVQELALRRNLRMSYLSGDVHACACGVFHSSKHIEPTRDPKYSLAVITSAIINAAPPPAVLSILNKLATKHHKTLLKNETHEGMFPLFDKLPNGEPNSRQKHILGLRNWCIVNYKDATDEVEFILRVETKNGSGTTTPYAITAPAPHYQ